MLQSQEELDPESARNDASAESWTYPGCQECPGLELLEPWLEPWQVAEGTDLTCLGFCCLLPQQETLDNESKAEHCTGHVTAPRSSLLPDSSRTLGLVQSPRDAPIPHQTGAPGTITPFPLGAVWISSLCGPCPHSPVGSDDQKWMIKCCVLALLGENRCPDGILTCR